MENNIEKTVRRPGIEPGSTAWKAAMLTTIPPTPRCRLDSNVWPRFQDQLIKDWLNSNFPTIAVNRQRIGITQEERILPYLAYTGMCHWTEYGFWPLYPKQGI